MDYEFDNSWTERIPKSVLIGNIHFDIQLMLGGEDREQRKFGYCSSTDQFIRLSRMMREPKARDTMLHEIMHAFFFMYNIDEEHEQEGVCSIFPMALDLLRRDNLELWQWLFPAIHTTEEPS